MTSFSFPVRRCVFSCIRTSACHRPRYVFLNLLLDTFHDAERLLAADAVFRGAVCRMADDETGNRENVFRKFQQFNEFVRLAAHGADRHSAESH